MLRQWDTQFEIIIIYNYYLRSCTVDIDGIEDTEVQIANYSSPNNQTTNRLIESFQKHLQQYSEMVNYSDEQQNSVPFQNFSGLQWHHPPNDRLS